MATKKVDPEKRMRELLLEAAGATESARLRNAIRHAQRRFWDASERTTRALGEMNEAFRDLDNIASWAIEGKRRP